MAAPLRDRSFSQSCFSSQGPLPSIAITYLCMTKHYTPKKKIKNIGTGKYIIQKYRIKKLLFIVKKKKKKIEILTCFWDNLPGGSFPRNKV